MKMRILIILFYLFLFTKSYSQNITIGALLNSEEALEGYTLVCSSLSRHTFLVDNCGREINSWTSTYLPGAVTYLLENGNLLRAGRVSGSFRGGGIGGIVEMFSWEGDLIWSYEIANEFQHQHHDLEFLPNGNILVLAWEKINQNEAVENGMTLNVGTDGVWPDMVLELKPIGNNDVEVVWQWRVWDHIIQDVDSTLTNYGVVSEHPEKINVNTSYNLNNGVFDPDWNHCNSIDYNEELDQIIISSRNFSEIWIIDHSTTIEEAASSSGGKYNKGGDLLYRWGNPRNYDRGDVTDQVFYGQHDAHWIEYGEDKGSIMTFNNGSPRRFSSVDIIKPQLDSAGNYLFAENNTYEPLEPNWSYSRLNGGRDFLATRTSGATRLPNGNTIITDGPQGLSWEITPDFEIVWEYQNPVRQDPLLQGVQATGMSVFRTYKYAKDYTAFENKELSPGSTLEINGDINPCELFTTSLYELFEPKINIFPNPVVNSLNIETFDDKNLYKIYNSNGQELRHGSTTFGVTSIDLSTLQKGIYFISIFDITLAHQYNFKFIKI